MIFFFNRFNLKLEFYFQKIIFIFFEIKFKLISKINFNIFFLEINFQKNFFPKKIILSSVFIFIIFSAQSQIILIDGSNKLCAGDSIALKVAKVFSSYSWSTGASESSIIVKTAGTYGVTVTDADAQKYIGSIYVPVYDNPPPPQIQGPPFICSQGVTTIFVDTLYASVHWSNGVTGNANTVHEAGKYSVTVTDANGCTSSTTDTVRAGNIIRSKLPRSITLCDKDSIVLNAADPDASSYYWSTDDSTSSITVRDSGMYNVIIGNGQCVSYDTTFVNTLPSPAYSLGNDTSICANDTIVLRVPNNAAYYYRWQNNAHDTFFSVKDSGLYTLRISLGSCDTTLQKHVAVFNLQKTKPLLDITVCRLPYRIIPDLTGVRAYKWQDGSTENFFDVTKSGKYNLTAYNRKCYTDVNYVVTLLDTPKINLGPDTVVCIQNNSPAFILKSGLPTESTSFLWSTRETTPNITVNFADKYYLLADNKCGRSIDSINIAFNFCNYMYVPTAFSPNDDGINDVLQLFPTFNVDKIIVFQIFNRWGILVFNAENFETTDTPQRTWNGKNKDSNYPPDVYVFHILYSTRDGKIYEKTGDVTLLR